jgi:drug/metabolite transporter (DMT)-like permease
MWIATMSIPKTRSTIGTLYCLLAPLGYTAYNLCLRGVSDKYDSAWITCVQASVSVVVLGDYLAWQAFHGRRALPPWRELLALLAIGLVTQIGGALMVWAMSVLGAGTTATLQMGVMLAGTAVLGRFVLGERVSLRQLGAIAMIVVAVVCFSRGAQSVSDAAVEAASDGASALTAGAAPTAPAAAGKVMVGIVAAILSGIAFAILVVGVRKTVTGATSPEAIVFLISLAGVMLLGPWSIARLGLDAIAETSARHLGVMLAAGLMNLIAFLLITNALQLATAVRVNVVNNALTMALTVGAGILLFAEPWNGELCLGIVLSMAGVVLISMGGPSPSRAETAS